MATIQFLAGNPKTGKKARKKTSKRVKRVRVKTKRGGTKLVAKTKNVKRKPSKAKKKASPAQLRARANFAKMAKARSKASKAKKVSPKRKKTKVVPNPRTNIYASQKDGKLLGKTGRGKVTAPTARELALITKQYKRALAKSSEKPANAERRKKAQVWAKEYEVAKKKNTAQMEEIKSMLKKGFAKVDVDHSEDSKLAEIEKRISQARKSSDKQKKAELTVLLKAKELANKKKKKKTKKKATKKNAKKATKKTTKKSQQGEKIVAKKARKKATKKVAKKATKKAGKKGGKKGGKKAHRAKRKTYKIHLRGKRSKSIGFKIFKNPSVEAVLGVAPAELAGLFTGGLSYGALNDLGKRYLPQSIAKVIAKAGPVSGAVIPAFVGIALLAVSKKYLSGKSYAKHVDQFAKGVIASAVVATGASAYELAVQKPLQKLIAPKGASPLAGYEDEMYGDDEFGAISESEFGEIEGDDEFGAISESEFGEVTSDEFGDIEGDEFGEIEGDIEGDEFGDIDGDSDY